MSSPVPSASRWGSRSSARSSGSETDRAVAEEISRRARPLADEADLDPLVERLADARHVLLGEASHGTSEYYRWRAAITRRLIADHGFDFVAVEGDWPDCFGVNCWVTGLADQDRGVTEVLRRFDRWPTWMWANHEVAEFLEWLRAHNRRADSAVGFYGLDVYSLWDSLDRIVGFVREHAHESLEATLAAVRCFEPYQEDPRRYALSSQLVPDGCETEVRSLLEDLRPLARRAGEAQGDHVFDALQNAEVLAGAERYYRAMIRADASSWNVRDEHMIDTFDRLIAHHGRSARGIVWAHNTHVGDASATDMASAGMTNIGQLARQRHGRDQVALVGFGGFEGTAVAGPRWGAPWQVMEVPPARDGSHEALIRAATDRPVWFDTAAGSASSWLRRSRPHRAIGVVYRPQRDGVGNWVPTVLGQRYDVFLSFGTTTALRPLTVAPRPSEELETRPWGT